MCVPLASCLPQAAADYAKAHLPESLRQQLQAFEREKRESAVCYANILEQRILAVDREMLDKLSANHDEAGWEGINEHEMQQANEGRKEPSEKMA